MTAVLLDINDECRTVGKLEGEASQPGGLNLVEALEQSANSPVRLITDWGDGAVFGLTTVAGSANTAAALLEKQLRDQGATDDISHLLVHQKQTRMGSTELVYSAVPVKTWRRYQQLAADHPQLVLVHDWVGTLLHWFKAHALPSAILLVLHAEGLDVLVMDVGRVRMLERLQIYQDESDAWGRLGQRVLSLVQDLDADESRPNTALVYPALLLVCQGAEAVLSPVIQGMRPVVVTEVWAESPDLTRSHLADDSLTVQRLDWNALAVSLPINQAANRTIDKAAAWADRSLPVIGLAAFVLSCIMAITSGFVHYRTQAAVASISGDVQKIQNLWQALNTDVQQADQLATKQKDLREWVEQRVGSSKVPDMVMVLAHVRKALPPGLIVDEVGLVVDKDAHLVTVVGHVGLIEDPLGIESAFAQALQHDGFVLKKRDLLLQDGKPKFKLSMIWSAV